MYLGIDIGGTKTLFSVFNSKGDITEQEKIKTPKNYNEFLKSVTDVVAKLPTKQVKWSVVAAPGKINRKHGIVESFGNLDWTNVPMQSDLEKILCTPVTLENDSNLGGLSEALLLKDKYRKSLYVTVSTGIGAGFVVDGKIEPNFADMEVGHMLLEYNGRLRSWEDFASGKAFYERFGKKLSDVAEDDHSTWYWLSRNLALGLLNLSATLTPDVIIIGGGAGAHLDRFKDQLDEQLKIYENPMFSVPPIVGAQRPEEAVIYGCYELAKQIKK